MSTTLITGGIDAFLKLYIHNNNVADPCDGCCGGDYS